MQTHVTSIFIIIRRFKIYKASLASSWKLSYIIIICMLITTNPIKSVEFKQSNYEMIMIVKKRTDLWHFIMLQCSAN